MIDFSVFNFSIKAVGGCIGYPYVIFQPCQNFISRSNELDACLLYKLEFSKKRNEKKNLRSWRTDNDSDKLLLFSFVSATTEHARHSLVTHLLVSYRYFTL